MFQRGDARWPMSPDKIYSRLGFDLPPGDLLCRVEKRKPKSPFTGKIGRSVFLVDAGLLAQPGNVAAGET